ncbi:MAG: RHS repeat-associated core domain-containing protein, partial [Thermoanaerobaculia bacterium]
MDRTAGDLDEASSFGYVAQPASHAILDGKRDSNLSGILWNLFRLRSYADALNNTTRYEYDALNRRFQTTWQDTTQETLVYDASHNVIERTDPNGTLVTQVFDPARRLTGRVVTPDEGVIGPLAETHDYDGLYRMTLAASGDVITRLAWDSLSRLIIDETEGRTVAYDHDDEGNVTGIEYPSGRRVEQEFDKLNRPKQIGSREGGDPGAPFQQAVTYGYRGPYLQAVKTLGNGLTSQRQFDPARRLLSDTYLNPAGQTVFQESYSWSPRNLKVGQSRGDLNGQGLVLAHDSARRLTHAAGLSDRAALPGNNSTPSSAELADNPEVTNFRYDAAENLLAATQTEDEVPEDRALPLDGSGRNRPGAVGEIPLTYDANGNLVTKGEMRFHFDFRNRLTRVTTGEGEAEEEIAAYAYDAFNRRVRKVVGETTEETVWSGWRALEQYENNELHSRRTYGRGLDEVVVLEQDLDGNGLVEMEYVPLYDETGNLVMVTRDEDAEPVERYEYTPYGTRTILVDSTPPTIEQVRVKDGEVWIEASEELLQVALDRVLADGTLRLTDLDAPEDLPLTADLPILTGRQARRRLIITTTDPPAPGANLRLTLPVALLVDTFLNTATEDFTLDFTWPDTDDVLFDGTAPRLEKVLVKDGHVELELTEEPDLTTTDAILIDGEPVVWELDESRYKLVTTTPLDIGAYTFEVSIGLGDLAGLPLTEPFASPIAIDPLTPRWLVFLAPDPREVSASTINNDLGFHGLEHDPETGLVYMRNRYFGPELARFISQDLLGYVDGPSLYQYGMYSPFNYSDPMGLDVEVIVGRPYRKPSGEWSPYGHVAVRVFDPEANQYDVTYDFGRYGRAWGMQNSKGEGILNEQAGPDYLAREAIHRTSIGYRVESDHEADQRVIDHFKALIAKGKRRRDIEKKLGYENSQSYQLEVEYNAAILKLGLGGNTCVSQTREGCEAGGTEDLGAVARALGEVYP